MASHPTAGTHDLFFDLPPFPADGDAAHQSRAALAAAWSAQPLEMFVGWMRTHQVTPGHCFSDRSQQVYLSMWGKFVKFAGAPHAATADSALIERFLQSLRGRLRRDQLATGRVPSAKRSVRRYLSLLSMLQRHLQLVGVRRHNAAAPMLAALGQEGHKPLPTALTSADEDRLRAAVTDWPSETWRDLRDHALLELLIGSGIKVSEVQQLTIDDVRLAAEPPQMYVRGARFDRIAPLARASLPVIEQWLSHRLRGRRPASSGDMLLFPSDDQTMLSASTIYRVVARAITRAKLNPIHSGPSVLRHTFATRQLRAGTELAVVSQWLGHKDEGSTAIYRFMLVNQRGAEPV